MLPRKVIWSLGALASPSHFQQMDRYFEESAKIREKALHPYAWGFTEFVLDEQLLSLGKVVLSKASGILPDGTLFEIGHQQKALSIDISPGTTNRGVMLSLPIVVAGGTEVRGLETSGLSTRFIRVPEEIRDHNVYEGKPSQPFSVPLGNLDFQLLFESDADIKGFIALPVAKIIECKPDGSVVLDKDFMPTFLHVDASPVLSGYFTEIIGLLTHRGDHLAVRVSSAGQTGSAELADFLLLQCINRMEPIFNHLSQIRGLHPEVFFRELLSLVGELATYVETTKRPQKLPTYIHSDQHAAFKALMLHARYALSTVLEQHAVKLVMQDRRDIKLVVIDDKKLLDTAAFILVAQANMDKEALRNLLPRQIKIGTPENIRNLVNSHLPGVKIQPLPVAPRQIPFHAGKSYFQLEFSAKERGQFETSTGCAIHVSGTFPGLQMEFWAIKE
jgi:type VI secretion system protein ImpJ